MSFDFDSLFSEEQTNLDAFKRVQRADSNVFKPKADKGKDGVYKAHIRFLPWYKNKQKSIIQKWSAWLVDPITNQGKSVDCPSSVGKPSDLYRMWKKLKESEDVSKQQQAEKFSRNLYCYSLVQILKDDNNPELVGKIMVFKYGKKIKDMIESEINPEIGAPKDPFNLLNGRRFILHIKKNGKWDDPTQSRFDGDSYPYLLIDGKNVDIANAMQDSSKRKEIAEWLENNSPNLEEFDFKEWDDDTIAHVNNLIRFVETGNYETGNNIEDAYSEVSASKPAKNQRAVKQKVNSIHDIIDDDISMPTTTSKSKKVVEDTVDDLDLSAFDDLD